MRPVTPSDVACPECHSGRGEPCVYRPVATNVDLTYLHYRPPALQARIARVGTPTRRPHNGRFAKAREISVARLRAKQRPAVPRASAAQRAIAGAQRQFEYLEYLQLRTWLARHAIILASEPGTACSQTAADSHPRWLRSRNSTSGGQSDE